MKLLQIIGNIIKPRGLSINKENDCYEFCPRCEANLTLQKGYRNDLPFWNCLGCGKMLINPDIDTDSDIAWICDGCGKMLNIQPGFHENCGEWICTECGFANEITPDEIYVSEDEFQTHLKDPYLGLSDMDILSLSVYREEGPLDGKPGVFLVRSREDGKRYVKKLITLYDRSIYSFLKDNPVEGMPGIVEIYEGSNCLVVIEEYIEGNTLEAILEKGTIPEKRAVTIVKEICSILDRLHTLSKPIIHRDVKPSNVIITPEGKLFLLDMNAAKWHHPEKNNDTRTMGTMYYAAPEQAGFGMYASSDRSDIYAVGMILNVMLTGAFPRERKASGTLWRIIERCISLDAQKRYSARELINALDEIQEAD